MLNDDLFILCYNAYLILIIDVMRCQIGMSCELTCCINCLSLWLHIYGDKKVCMCIIQVFPGLIYMWMRRCACVSFKFSLISYTWGWEGVHVYHSSSPWSHIHGHEKVCMCIIHVLPDLIYMGMRSCMYACVSFKLKVGHYAIWTAQLWDSKCKM